MPELANARHELFAALIAFGKAPSAKAAYLQVGYKAKTDNVAEAAASRLLGNVKVSARIKELQAARVERLNIETTDIVRSLNYVRLADPRKLVRKKGKRLEQVPLDELDDATALAIKSVEPDGQGGFRVTFADRIQANRLLGMHLGMFQGESAGSVGAPGGTTIIDNSKNITYIDAPRRETMEEWKARIERERAPKQIEAKAV